MELKAVFVVLLISILTLVISVGVNSAEQCRHHIQKIQSYPDGYQARLALPVLEATNKWKVEIEYNKNISVFDTADGNLENDVKSGLKITVTNYIHNGVLQIHSKLVINFNVHFPREIDPPPRISKISFGKFFCQSEDQGVVKEGCVFANSLPLCANFMTKVNTWKDGFHAKLTLPINRSVNSWQLLLIFNKQITVLDFPNGNLENKVNSQEFKITSKIYNGKQIEGGTVTFDLTVHYERGQTGTDLVAIIFDPVQFICTNDEYKKILEKRYRNANTTTDALIGANWIGRCEKSIPECSKIFKVSQSWADGFQGTLFIPVATTVDSWNITVYFDGKIRNFDVHQGEKIRTLYGVYFVVRNYRHNARQYAGTTFQFHVTVHFSRTLKKRPQISFVSFRDEDVCENKDACDN